MKNGYNIFWTDFALKELANTIEYIEQNWSEKELRNLAENLEETLNLISKKPDMFQVSEFKKDVRRVVVLKFNTIYYRFNNNQIEILSFFSNRQDPNKIKL